MPDLILWSAEKGTAKFSEVKSESDRLSEVQISWLNFFRENDIQAEVCYINRQTQAEEEGQDPAQLIDVFTKDKNWISP